MAADGRFVLKRWASGLPAAGSELDVITAESSATLKMLEP
jgi:hypothetical protein